MKLPLSWLKEWLPINESPQKIAETLTMLGLEVEGFDYAPLPFKDVIVVKVLSVAPHPNADRLQLAKVTDGKQIFDIVCGASNCREGIKTALAKVGAVLANPDSTPFIIQKNKIRGFTSEGMLCSPEELHLSGEEFGSQEGILELPNDYKEGSDLKEYLADIVFEISLTPNLGHCSSILGIARELSAAFQIPIQFPVVSIEEDSEILKPSMQIDISDFELCPRYVCRLVTDVKVAPSPEWLTKRLIASGMRPINNVVDITNYVLLEFGHPLHAFDFDKIEGNLIQVRKAEVGESITTLDQKERFPTPEALLICDAKKPIAIAGIMGGLDSQVTYNTQRVLIESAYFKSTTIRRASKQLNLSTEASRRFERGIDPNILAMACDRVAQLLVQICGGQVQDMIDHTNTLFAPKEVCCRVKRTNEILGTQLSSGEVENLLQRLDFEVMSSEGDLLYIKVPTYRCDIHTEIDLIEEVARLYGFENIYTKKQVSYREGVISHAPLYLFEKNLRQILLREGLQELLNVDLISPKLASLVAPDCMPQRALIHLLNYSSLDQSILRPSLLPNLLQVVKWNMDHNIFSIAGYEIGKVHFKTKTDYMEATTVAIVLTGERAPLNWEKTSQKFDFYDLKGILENLFSALRVEHTEFSASSYSNFHPHRQAEIFIEDLQIGLLGQVHPETTAKIDVQEPVYFAEINIENLMTTPKFSSKMRPLPHFPATSRDLTLTLKQSCFVGKILKMIQRIPSRLLETCTLLDVYRSEKLGPDWKNVTFRFVYRDQEKTISFKAADFEHSRIVEILLKTLKDEEQIL